MANSDTRDMFRNMNNPSRSERSKISGKSQTTLDIFQINSQSVNKEIGKVYDYAKKRNTSFVKIQKSGTDSVIKYTLKSYSDMYSKLEKMHGKYIDAVRKMNNGISVNTDYSSETAPSRKQRRSSSSSSHESRSAYESRQRISEIEAQLNREIQQKNKRYSSFSDIIGIRNERRNNTFEDEKQALRDKFNRGEITEEKFTSSMKELSNNQAKYNRSSEATHVVLVTIANTIKNIASIYLKPLTQGYKDYANAWEQYYTGISTRLDTNRSETDDLLKSGQDQIKSLGLNNVVSYAKDLIPALDRVAKQGLLGDNAVAKAVQDSIDNKLMPWLQTDSEAYLQLYQKFDTNEMKQLKNQQLSLRHSESGNRLLQSGVINSLMEDIEPLLTNIDFNTGGYENLSGELQGYMVRMLDQGFSAREAYAEASRIANLEKKGYYAAITSGDVSDVLYASSRVQGRSVTDALEDSAGKLLNMTEGMNDLATSAFLDETGTNKLVRTVNQAGADQARPVYEELSKFVKNQKVDSDEYNRIIQEATQKITATSEYDTKMENWSAEILGWTKDIAHGTELISSLISGIKAIIGTVIGSKITSFLGSKLSSGSGILGKIGSKLGFGGGSSAASGAGAAGTSSSGLSGLLGKTAYGVRGGGVSWGGAIGGGAMLAAGLVMGGMDAASAVEATKPGQRGGKIGQGIRGFFTGGKNMTNEEEADAFKKAIKGEKRSIDFGAVVKNAGKGALIGGGIASIVPGWGTAIGGIIGGAIGAVTNLVDQVVENHAYDKIAEGTEMAAEGFEKMNSAVSDLQAVTQKQVAIDNAKSILDEKSIKSGKEYDDAISKLREAFPNLTKGIDDATLASEEFRKSLEYSVQAEKTKTLQKMTSAAATAEAGRSEAMKGYYSLINSRVSRYSSGSEEDKNLAFSDVIDQLNGFIETQFEPAAEAFKAAYALDPNSEITKSSKDTLQRAYWNNGYYDLLSRIKGITIDGDYYGNTDLWNRIEPIYGIEAVKQRLGLIDHVEDGKMIKYGLSFAKGTNYLDISSSDGAYVKAHNGEMIVTQDASNVARSVGFDATDSGESIKKIINESYKYGQQDNGSSSIVKAIEVAIKKVIAAIYDTDSESTKIITNNNGVRLIAQPSTTSTLPQSYLRFERQVKTS